MVAARTLARPDYNQRSRAGAVRPRASKGVDMLDLVIRGGRVVTPSGVGEWDLGVQGERIAALGAPGTLEAGRVIDATGKVVVPGGIDPHTHLAHPIMSHPDEPGMTLGPEEDTRGMLFGGTTTHIDFAFVRPGGDIRSAIEQRSARWKGGAYTDYSFHVVLAGALELKVFEDRKSTRTPVTDQSRMPSSA